MTAETMSLKELIASKRITMTCEWGAPENPDMPDMDPWTCVLRYGRRRMTVPFYMGLGHNGKEPTVNDVLDCLLSDAHSAGTNDFEDWCDELGYDADSRKAERIYKACLRTYKRLNQFLGNDFETFLYADR